MEKDAIANLASTHLATCAKLKNITSPFILILGESDNIFTALQYCALNTNLQSATVSALGSVRDIKLSYFQHHHKQHKIKTFEGIYEIASLVGSITFFQDQPFIHLHAGISQDDFIVYGGHVIDAYSGPASEFIINPLNAAIQRTFDPKIGIYTICQEIF